MHSFYINKRWSLCTLFSMFIFVACVFSVPANAQDYSPAGVARSMGVKPISEYAYSDDKGGCAKKAAMFVAVSRRYSAGDAAEDIFKVKMFQPLVLSIYSNIRKNGLELATLNNMIGYSNCVDKASPNSNPEKEYDLSLVHDACKKMNDVLLFTLDSIKKRKKIDTVIHKYSRKPIDFYGTKYEKLLDAEILFIGDLYHVANRGEYSDVIFTASNISIGCYE